MQLKTKTIKDMTNYKDESKQDDVADEDMSPPEDKPEKGRKCLALPDPMSFTGKRDDYYSFMEMVELHFRKIYPTSRQIKTR